MRGSVNRPERPFGRGEARLPELFSISSDFFWETDAEHRLQRMEYGAAMHGCAPVASVVGRTRWELPYVSPDESGWRAHREALDARLPFRDFEFGRPGSDGRGPYYYSISGEPVFDAEGRFAGYRGVGSEITRRVRAEQAVRQSEARFRGLIRLSSDWYWELDHEFRMSFLSSELEQKTGLDRSSLLGKHSWDQPALNLGEADWERFRALLAAHEPFHDFEMERPLDGGGSVWLSITGEPVFDSRGEFTGYRGVGRDITDRKRAERRLLMEHDVSRCIAQADALGEGLVGVLRAICEAEGWECGRYFGLDEASGTMRLEHAWHIESGEFEEFVALTRKLRFPRGGGLVGRVWETAEPIWAPDLRSDPRVMDSTTFDRHPLIRSDFEFPVLSQGMTVGVISVASRVPRPPDAQLMEAVRAIGGQVGQFVARKAAEAQRQAAERAIRESEARFRRLTQLSSDWYWEQDAELRFVQTGGLTDERGGITAGEHIGKRRWELPGTEIVSETWEAHKAVLESRKPFRDLLLRRTGGKDGFHFVSVAGEPMFEGGEFRGYRGVARDVTELVRAEQALRLLTDNVPAMICYFDRDCRYRYANRQYREFYAGGADSIDGKTLREVLGERVWPAVCADVEAALAGKPVSRNVKRMRPSDAAERHLEVSLVPHGDGAERTHGVYVLTLDVTERSRTEEVLRLRTRAVESSLNSIMILKPAGDDGRQVIDDVNPAFERITGYSRDEVIGRDPRFLHGEDRDQPGIAELRRAVREHDEASVLLRNYRKDGTMFWHELRVAPVRDEAGHVSHMIGAGNDVSERVRYEEQLERQANYDSLTGLPNRNLFNDRLAQAILQARRSGSEFGLVLVDLDQLKRINDSLGHDIGDRVIVAAGRRIAEALRTGDTVARLGGDEFVVLLQGPTDEQTATTVATRLLNFVGTPIRIEAHEFSLTASLGIALYPRDGSDGATLLRNADAALYSAKEEGRNCFRFFAPDMNERLVRFLALEQELRAGLERREFRLHYQPIVDLESGEPVGAEALIRWRRPDGSMGASADFVPVAEESGLILPIGRWVIEEAARQAAAWNRGKQRPFHVSINLSARQFRDPGLLESIRAALKLSRVEPSVLRFEITESTVMHNVAEALRLMRALKELGVKLSVDDFGTGYSSLGYLKRFPIDVLKIDRSFVRDLPRGRNALAICRAVIALGEGLGLEIIAEGVETAGQAGALRANGCTLAQGFLFSRPVEPEKLSRAASNKLLM